MLKMSKLFVNRKKTLTPSTMSKTEAKEVLLQFYRDINDNNKGVFRNDIKNYVGDMLLNELCEEDYNRIMGAIETLCVPSWLLHVRHECRKRNLI